MASIKLTSIEFGDIPFRKLKTMVVKFAPRMTVIAGHNGIGKSTIMALVANSSGFSSSPPATYMERAYQANMFDIVHIDYKKEYLDPRKAGLALPQPIIEYQVNEDASPLRKACSLTGRTDSRKARVVPRNHPHKDFASEDGALTVGKDAKVPLPTIYLGMTRMLPVGESNPTWVKQALDKAMPEDDRKFLSEFINAVIGAGTATTVSITTQRIAGTGKTSKHPEYPHSAMCVSLGQDSLSAIATAVASFQKLKRDLKAQYIGGLLVIDEIDAGFHPRAQEVLIRELLSVARKLDLQIVATTHSMCIVEAVHPDSKPAQAKRLDGVVYLMDKAQPYVADDFSLESIRADMSLLPPKRAKPPPRKPLKVYFEDAEAAYVFKIAAPAAVTGAIGKELKVKLAPMPLSMGCQNLMGLAKHDPYFKQVVIAVDADTSVPATAKNVVKLPGAKQAGAGLSPERTILQFVKALADHPDKHADSWAQLKKARVTTEHLREYVLKDAPTSDKRDALKGWWASVSEHVEEWDLYKLWMDENPATVQQFRADLKQAAAVAARLL